MSDILRRDFLKAVPAAAALLAQAAQEPAGSNSSTHVALQPFDYQGVRLLKSRWQQQVQTARDYYYALTDDDILHGFRAGRGIACARHAAGRLVRTRQFADFWAMAKWNGAAV